MSFGLPPAKRLKLSSGISSPAAASIPLAPDLALERQNSEHRLRAAWEDIIARYSQPDLPSDEILLATGELVVDNGHLRGLDVKGNVWKEGKGAEESIEVEEVEPVTV